MGGQTEGVSFPFPELGSCGRPWGTGVSPADPQLQLSPAFPPGRKTLRKATSEDHSSGPVPGLDQEPREPRPWPGLRPAWLPPQCQAFPSEPRSWAVMAGGPGLLPGSLPASQAPGQGQDPCNHHCPGRTGQAVLPGQGDKQHAALLWPEYPTGQGSVPRPPGASLASSPASSPTPRGPAGKQGAISPSLGMHLPASPPPPLPPDPPSGPLDTPALFTLPASSASTQTAVEEEQVPDRTPAPRPDAAAPRPDPQRRLPPPAGEGPRLARRRSGETFRDKGGDTFQTPS